LEQCEEFDLIHNHYDYLLMQLLRMTEVPVLTTLHGRQDLPDLCAVYEYFPDAPLVSISDAQRAPMPHLNWIATVKHGIDLDTFSPKTEPGKYLAFLGRMSPEKGPDAAIDIAHASGVPLRMAAKVAVDDRDYYEKLIRPRIDGKFIEFIGEIGEHEKSEFLGGALALAFPIDWPEPLGLAMLEAMACGTPVLARLRGSVPEIVEEGVTGFARESVAELAKLVPACGRLDRAAISRRAAERFSIGRMTEEYLNVYKRLITGKRGNRAPGEGMARHRRNQLHPLDRPADRHRKGIA
jgi:glycosyltransferase involved in cell wall biosynthesis